MNRAAGGSGALSRARAPRRESRGGRAASALAFFQQWLHQQLLGGRQELLAAVAVLARRRDVALHAAAAARDRHDMVHGQLALWGGLAAVGADSTLNAPLPPRGLAQRTGPFALAGNVLSVRVYAEPIVHSSLLGLRGCRRSAVQGGSAPSYHTPGPSSGVMLIHSTYRL